MRARRRSGATAWIHRLCVKHLHAEPHPARMTQRRTLLSRLSFSTLHEQCSQRQEQSMEKRNFRRVIAPASLVLGVCGVGSAAVSVQTTLWTPHPIHPQLCHNQQGSPSTPLEPGGYCDIEVRLTRASLRTGKAPPTAAAHQRQRSDRWRCEPLDPPNAYDAFPLVVMDASLFGGVYGQHASHRQPATGGRRRDACHLCVAAQALESIPLALPWINP